MTSVLIVSASEKKRTLLNELLAQNNFIDISAVSSCGEARRSLSERDYDLCVIDAPLPDEFGVNLARKTADESITQVIFLAAVNLYDEVCHKTEDAGVLTVAKPMTRESFWHALKMAGAAFNKISRLRSENARLLTTIDDIRIIDRAKCLLIETLRMTEAEAHRYIEKQSMDMRITKKAVAQNVIKTYENK